MNLKRSVFVLCIMIMFAVLAGISGSGASIAQSQEPGATERTKSSVVGASIAHPEEWYVERESSEHDGTLGFVVWKPQSGTVKDHGGAPVVRVALAHELDPGQVGKTVREKLAAYPDLPLNRQRVKVGGRDCRAWPWGRFRALPLL